MLVRHTSTVTGAIGAYAFRFFPSLRCIKMKMKSLVFALSVAMPLSAQALTITTNNDASALANVLVGSGVGVSNAVLVGAATQQGTFSGGAGAIGIDAGVILTSGNATLAAGPNNQDGATGVTGTGSDPDLAALVPGLNLNDANVLEFDFTTTTGDLFFSYVFASDEYNEFVNSSFNDVFGFFVNGVNIALIPGTSTPVSINTVNCGFSSGGALPGSNPNNCDKFNNNDLQNGGPFFDIQYDGFTDVFLASVIGLGAGTHHIKLAIADGRDSSLDSAVFLQAGSFTDVDPTDPTIPEPATLALLGLGLVGLSFARRRKAG